MQVRDFLTAVVTTIDHDAVTPAEPFGDSNLRNHEQAPAHNLFVLIAQIGQRDDLFLGDHQDVGGSLGGDVAKGQAEIVLVHDIGGNLAVDDLGEDGWHGRSAATR